MISVEERHELIQKFEAAITARRHSATVLSNRDSDKKPGRIDVLLDAVVRCEDAERSFYVLVNELTVWSHQQVQESKT